MSVDWWGTAIITTNYSCVQSDSQLVVKTLLDIVVCCLSERCQSNVCSKKFSQHISPLIIGWKMFQSELADLWIWSKDCSRFHYFSFLLLFYPSFIKVSVLLSNIKSALQLVTSNWTHNIECFIVRGCSHMTSSTKGKCWLFLIKVGEVLQYLTFSD